MRTMGYVRWLFLAVMVVVPALGDPGELGAQNPFPVGTKVEVLWSSTWYKATVKAERGPARWFIGYDGFGTNWDEEVGPERIRLPGTRSATPGGTGSGRGAGAPATATGASPGAPLAWPNRPARGTTPIEGVYFVLRTTTSLAGSSIYINNVYEAWFFTRNGRFFRSPEGGVTLQELAARPRPGADDGSYWVEGGQLVLAWADGSEPWRSRYEGHDRTLVIGSITGTRQSGFPPGWRLDGSYEGGASIAGGALSSSSTLTFRRDGSYRRGSVTSITSTGTSTEVTGGAVGSATGTYQFDEYTLTLRENGTERKYTVFAYGTRDAAGRPEQLFWEGTMARRLDR